MDLVPSYILAKQVSRNISSARKVFKFLKFIDEYRSFVDLLKKGYSTDEKSKEAQAKTEKYGTIEIDVENI